MKANNIYDNTSIIICSDHGCKGKDTIRGKSVYHRLAFDMTLMIKPFNQRNEEIAIDYSKIQSIDILPSLLYLACGNNASYDDFAGLPFPKIPSERKRTVYVSQNHPDIPTFDGSYNNLAEFNFVNVEQMTSKISNSFVRNIPLNIDAKVDEKTLKTYWNH